MNEWKIMDWQAKFFFLDTNILIHLLKAPQGMEPFLKYIKDNDGVLCTIDAVSFELLRYARTKTEKQALSEFIKNYFVINIREDDITAAIEISQLCFLKDSRNKKQISYIDSLLASQLLKYKDRVVLVTTDCRDFPIFKRAKVEAYDLGTEVIAIAYVVFDRDEIVRCRANFEKTA